MWITDWTTRAACKGTDPDELFVQGAAQNRAKLICRGCPVRTECLADALDNGIEFGVWGGMTERERRALLRRRPDVKSWRELLETARDRYERQGIDELVASAGILFFCQVQANASPTRRSPARSCTSSGRAGTSMTGTAGWADMNDPATRCSRIPRFIRPACSRRAAAVP